MNQWYLAKYQLQQRSKLLLRKEQPRRLLSRSPRLPNQARDPREVRTSTSRQLTKDNMHPVVAVAVVETAIGHVVTESVEASDLVVMVSAVVVAEAAAEVAVVVAVQKVETDQGPAEVRVLKTKTSTLRVVTKTELNVEAGVDLTIVENNIKNTVTRARITMVCNSLSADMTTDQAKERRISKRAAMARATGAMTRSQSKVKSKPLLPRKPRKLHAEKDVRENLGRKSLLRLRRLLRRLDSLSKIT